MIVKGSCLETEYGWDGLDVVIVRPGDTDPNGPCAEVSPRDDFLNGRLTPGGFASSTPPTSNELTEGGIVGRYIELQPTVCLEAGVTYEVRLSVREQMAGRPDRSPSFLLDSLVLSPPTSELDIFTGDAAAERHGQNYERYQCRHSALSLTPADHLSQVCKDYLCPVAAITVKMAIRTPLPFPFLGQSQWASCYQNASATPRAPSPASARAWAANASARRTSSGAAATSAPRGPSDSGPPAARPASATGRQMS